MLTNTKQMDDKLKYDCLAKKMLSKKVFLAHIMKSVLKEYQQETIDNIIHKDIETIENENPTIIGNQAENTYAGKIVYDILFTAKKPKEKTNLLIDVEAQKDEPSTYELSTRGIYYSSCLLADQKDKYFKKMNYQDCLKNYSIWVVMNPKKEKRGSIDLFCTERYNLVGNSTYNKKDYDLVNVVMICLDSTRKEERNDIVGMLSLLFSNQVEGKEKIKRLKEDYGIQLDVNEEKEMRTMCNLAQGFEDMGEVKGRIKEKNRILTLIRYLSENGEMDKIVQLPADEQLLEEMCKKYHVS